MLRGISSGKLICGKYVAGIRSGKLICGIHVAGNKSREMNTLGPIPNLFDHLSKAQYQLGLSQLLHSL